MNLTLAASAPHPPGHDPAATLNERYRRVRGDTLRLAQPLRPEDMVVQTAEFASPTKWHLAHTTWFFERFVLGEFLPGYTPHHPRYEYLFNSYYNTVGPQHCRANRGAVSRPDVAEVRAYRDAVDARLLDWLDAAGDTLPAEARRRIVIGLHHEQQHQELVLTDIKYTLATNPLLPAYVEQDPPAAPGHPLPQTTWTAHEGGLVEIGRDAADPADGPAFAYDNESPRHRVYLQPFALADRLVSNAEFSAFIDDGGYRRHDLWLSAGWAWVQQQAVTHPLYWFKDESREPGWWQVTLHGPRPLADAEPACHLSYFEADAFSRWAGARLPSEAEWETLALSQSADPDAGRDPQRPTFHVADMGDTPGETAGGLSHLYGQVWQWTRSDYAAYPGYRPAAGALGEYNGKFMCNQYVLRGSSLATPLGHARPTYRNFFGPADRWQFAGLRLARDA
jgi:ergothioneine biosynthesis protein EgtB